MLMTMVTHSSMRSSRSARACLLLATVASALKSTYPRRAFLGTSAVTAATIAQTSNAASKTGLLNIDGVEGNPLLTVEINKRPPIPKFVRAELQQDFAVCLMRNSYNVVDGLDFVAMDAFQKRFFLARQDEWEPYYSKARQQLGRPPNQGELTDPLYFDFISFAQYKVINEFLRAPKQAFEELVTAEGDTTVVIRNATSVENAKLADEHSRRVGDAALDFVLSKFSNLPPTTGVLAPQPMSPAELAANVNKLCVLIAVLGFSVDASATLVGSALRCEFVAPANYWGLKVLAGSPLSRQPLLNDFGAKIVGAYLARCGFFAARSLEFTPVAYAHVFKLKV